MKSNKLEVFVIMVIYALITFATGLYIGWRWGMHSERERIFNEPMAETNWWKRHP